MYTCDVGDGSACWHEATVRQVCNCGSSVAMVTVSHGSGSTQSYAAREGSKLIMYNAWLLLFAFHLILPYTTLPEPA